MLIEQDLPDAVDRLVNVYLEKAESSGTMDEEMMWIHRSQGVSAAWLMIRDAVRNERCKGDCKGGPVSRGDIQVSRLGSAGSQVPEVP